MDVEKIIATQRFPHLGNDFEGAVVPVEDFAKSTKLVLKRLCIAPLQRPEQGSYVCFQFFHTMLSERMGLRLVKHRLCFITNSYLRTTCCRKSCHSRESGNTFSGLSGSRSKSGRPK